MYLLNTSTTKNVVVNTARGKVGIKAQDVADIRYKILPPVSKSLKQLTEDEYLNFLEERKGTTEAVIEAKGKDIDKPTIVAEEEKLDDLERIEDEVVETDIKNPSIMSFVNSLIEKPQINEKENEALVVTDTDSINETAEIEQQIADLKISWQATKSPRKKEKISKEIKELQKQLKKIKK